MVITARNFRRTLAVGTAAILTATLAATPAAAHTELRDADPEEGAQVEVLDQVRLEFSSALLDIGTELVLIDAAGAEHALEPEFPAGENAVVGDVEGAEIAAGAAVLDWRVVAEDGHPIEGEISFTYAPATVEEPQVEPGTTAEAAPADEPQADDPAPSVESEPVVDLTPISAEPISEEPESEDLALWAWVLIGLALVGLVVTALAMSKKRDDA